MIVPPLYIYYSPFCIVRQMFFFSSASVAINNILIALISLNSFYIQQRLNCSLGMSLKNFALYIRLILCFNEENNKIPESIIFVEKHNKLFLITMMWSVKDEYY